MKNFITTILLVFCMFFQTNASFAANNTVTLPTKAKPQTAAVSADVNYLAVQSPVLVVNNPNAYLNKNIEFTAKFNKFSTLGLDYKPAMRESQIYLGILIDRDDVGSYTIPLSELKLFIKRKDAEKLTDLDAGDMISIKGKVFSVALGDPWMDITKLKILTPKNKTNQTQKTDK
ncbi:MAG: hypothetical protein K6C94_08310 [Candidatus Gastranaerophilales bacterium]|nr:hypothetical protein [Candidatus Gastranaerophilales bacterium]